MPDKSYLQVTTVYDFLKSADCLGLLKSPDVITATTAIVDKVYALDIANNINTMLTFTGEISCRGPAGNKMQGISR